jgi:hypothetical protein
MIANHLRDPAAVHAPTPNASELDECTKLIRKLRWVGLDEEARRLEAALRDATPNARGAVLAEPSSTD